VRMFGVLRREKLVQLGFTPSKTVRLEFDQLCLLQKLHFIARTSLPVDTLVITWKPISVANRFHASTRSLTEPLVSELSAHTPEAASSKPTFCRSSARNHVDNTAAMTKINTCVYLPA